MNKIFSYLFVVLCTIGCISKKQTASKAGEREHPGAESLSADTRFQDKFFAAQLEKSKDNLNKAYSLFHECLQIDPVNGAVHFELGRIELQMKSNAEQALAHAKAALSTNMKNPWYHLLAADSYMALGKYDMAVRSFRQVALYNPNDKNIFFRIATAQIYQKKYDDAIATYNELEKQIGPDEELSMQKHQLYLQMNQPEKAGAEIEKLAQAYPTEPRYWGMAAQYYATIHETEKAKRALEEMVKTDPDNGQVHFQLSEYYAAVGEDAKSYSELEKAFGTLDISIDQKIAVLLKYFALTDFDRSYLPQAYQLLGLTEKMHPAEAKAYSIYGDFLAREGRDLEALQKYRKACELDPSHSLIWQQIIQLDNDTRDFKAMLNDAAKAMELFPALPQFYYFYAEAAKQHQQYDEAIRALNTGKELVVEDDAALCRFYLSLGAAYHYTASEKKSDEAFEMALQLQPNNPLALNNYSYYLALRRSNLERAAQMAALANSLQPNQSSFEDTYAAVLFVQGKYTDALHWIEKALSHGEPSGEMLERSGDILARLNRNAEAVAKWKEAKQAGNASNRIDKKIAEQRYIE